MKQYWKRTMAFFFCLIIAAGRLPIQFNLSAGTMDFAGHTGRRIYFSKSYEEKKEQAEKRKQELEQDKMLTEQKMQELRAGQNNLKEDIENYDRLMQENDAYIEDLLYEMGIREAELKETRDLLEETKEKEKIQYETMSKRIQYMYENGNYTIFDTLSNSASLTDFLNQAEYFSKITEYDTNLFQDYITIKQQAEETEDILELEIENYEELEAAAENKRLEMLVLQADKMEKMQQAAADLNIQEEFFEFYLDELILADADIDRIEAEEQERIRIEEEKRKQEEEARKKLEEERKQALLNAASNIDLSDAIDLASIIWPLPGDGRTYSGFGPRTPPLSGASSYHQGVDIGGEYGASIVASLAGTVEIAGYSTTGGNYIRINHGDGVLTSYLHCSKLLVTVGEYVQQGEVIGLVGSTGVSTAPHLHFSIAINGTYVDPMNYIHYE